MKLRSFNSCWPPFETSPYRPPRKNSKGGLGSGKCAKAHLSGPVWKAEPKPATNLPHHLAQRPTRPLPYSRALALQAGPSLKKPTGLFLNAQSCAATSPTRGDALTAYLTHLLPSFELQGAYQAHMRNFKRKKYIQLLKSYVAHTGCLGLEKFCIEIKEGLPRAKKA